MGEMGSQSVRSRDVSTVVALTSCTHSASLPATSCSLGVATGCLVKAGQPRRRGDAFGCHLLAERKALQLQEVMCVPSWEHSLSDKQGLWIWGTSGDTVTCLQLSCSVGDAAGRSGSARLALSRRLFVLV